MRKIKYCIIWTMLTAVMLTGCGSQSSIKEISGGGADTYSRSADIYESAAEAPAENMQQETTEISADISRKLIKEVSLRVETEEFDSLYKTITQRVTELGGYIESAYTDSYSGNYRNNSMTIRIPSKSLEGFVTQIGEQSNIRSKQETVRDVTLQYIDLESHVASLKAEMESLLAMLEKAEKLEDIVTIQGRITEVRYQIESMESQRRTLSNQVEYSTVYLDITEVARVTAVTGEEDSVWNRMSTGFSTNMYKVLKGVQNFGIGLVVCLPYILLLVVVIGFMGLIIWGSIKIANKKHEKKILVMKKQEPKKQEQKKQEKEEQEK